MRRRPYSVVLFDEIEKAHPDVMHLLLQILEEGKVTDSFGSKVDFRNTIIIMTSNIGAELIKKSNVMGFGVSKRDEQAYDVMKEKILEEAKRILKPEFVNRLDDLIVFHTLGKPELLSIVELETKKVLDRIKIKEINLMLDEKRRNCSSKKVTTPHMVRVRCAALWSGTSRIQWRRKFFAATSNQATSPTSPPKTESSLPRAGGFDEPAASAEIQ